MNTQYGVNEMATEQLNNYEIYTRCPKTGECGWDIELVRSTKSDIESYPLFDCVITVNDTRAEVLWDGLTATPLG